MTYAIRAARAGEFPGVIAPIFHYFGRGVPTPDFADALAPLLPTERIHAAFDDGDVVGSASVFPLEMSVPGGFVRAAGVTLVGVLPTHRRRGILGSLMRAQLDDIHERGEPVAYLWASEDALYGRYGYGVASFTGDVELQRDRAAFSREFPPQGRIRVVSADEAVEPFSEIQRRAAARYPGMFVRTPEWWRSRRLADPEWRREGGGEMVRVLLELDGRPAAYALYRLHFLTERGIPSGYTKVIEAVADSPEGTRELWSYLIGIDWMKSVRAQLLPLDHELFLLLREPRRLQFNLRDGLWVRLVDVERALNARSFKPGEPVVLELADDFCPWNTGRYVVGPDGARRTETQPDLRLPVESLGSAYLGGFTFAQLARAGRVDELGKGALDRADALFRTDCYPWCPEIF